MTKHGPDEYLADVEASFGADLDAVTVYNLVRTQSYLAPFIDSGLRRENLTAAQLNTYQRDNLKTTSPAIVTTASDVVYASAANTVARLAAGTDGAPFVYDTGTNAPTWPVDFTDVGVEFGFAGASTGTLSESTSYTNHASNLFTMPTGWVSAQLTAWGVVSVQNSDGSQTLRAKIRIGSSTTVSTGSVSTGTVFNGGLMSSKHDMTVTPMHNATVTSNSSVHVAATISGSTINTLRMAHTVLAWTAVRKS